MEMSREIFDECCNEVASKLSLVGFHYRGSRHSAIRASGDLKFEIQFQSSSRNYLVPQEGASRLAQVASKLMPFGDLVTFGSVKLIAHATVHSNTMKVFRESLPATWIKGDAIAGGQIGNLQKKAMWIEFNLANPMTRKKNVRDILGLIEGVALPYFELFQNPEDVIARLLEGTMPWIWEPSALEYVRCFGSAEQAVELLNRYLKQSPDNVQDYRKSLLSYRAEGIPDVWESGTSARLAKTAVVLGLDDDMVEVKT